MARRHGQAYCGNKPDARPEDADRANAVPIAEFRKVLEQTIADYHARPHRGDAMEGRCPLDVYRSLIEAPGTVVKRATAAQLRVLLQAAVKVKLDPRDHSVTILGNRYWTRELAEVPDGRFYTVRYNPDDASEPVAIYERERYLFDAPLIDRTGFRDRDRARDHARNKRRFHNSLKERDEAMSGMRGARQWLPAPSDTPKDEPPAAEQLPVSKVVQPLQLPRAFMPIDDEKERRRAEAERVRAELFGRKVGGT